MKFILEIKQIIRNMRPTKNRLYHLKAFLAFPRYYIQGVIVCPGSLIGKDVKIGFGTRINKPSEISGGTQIGRHCAIGGGLLTISSNHKTDSVIMSANLANSIGGLSVCGLRENIISIGDGVWLGRNVIILANVAIGEGSVIAAGSIVTKDVPPYAIAAGVPARVIRSRIPENLVPRLLSLKIFSLDLNIMRKIKNELTSTLDAKSLDKIESIVLQN